MWLIIILIIQFGIGTLLSLPALLPQIHRIGRDSKKVRVTKSLIFGLLTVVIMIGGYTWLGSYVRITFLSMGLDPCYSPSVDVREEITANKSAIVTELWLRGLSPLDRPCYAGQITICTLANRIESETGLYNPMSIARASVRDGLFAAVLFLFPGVVAGTLVWRFSRPVLRPSNKEVEVHRKIFQQISEEEGESDILDKG